MNNKNQPNKTDLIEKAKQLDYNEFNAYCEEELNKLGKVKNPMKNEYYRFLSMVNYVVGTGDIKGAETAQESEQKIAKSIVQYYEKKGSLPAGTTDKFDI